MRNAFAEEITRLASKNKKIVLLSGDIGNRLFDKFRNKFPNRFYNCGIAEACMTGVASGISSVGLRPVTYTIATFNTIRCLEQIKLDICYTNLPVIIVGTGAGLSYASLGSTHHSLDDISFLRTIPNLNILGLNVNDTQDAASIFITELEINYPVAIEKANVDEVINQFSWSGIPTSIIINKEKKIIVTIYGEIKEKKIVSYLNSLSNE